MQRLVHIIPTMSEVEACKSAVIRLFVCVSMCHTDRTSDYVWGHPSVAEYSERENRKKLKPSCNQHLIKLLLAGPFVQSQNYKTLNSACAIAI